MSSTKLAASFRDPAGFLFSRNGALFRQINHSYKSDYDQLMDSGLYNKLVTQNLLIAHQETDEDPAVEGSYKVIQPEFIPHISYPYEWSFSQLKEAALQTLKVQQIALDNGMSLKDASAFNVQFIGSKAVFIDTLSFETLDASKPWVAYRQFCQHFLGPLALMAYRDVRVRHLWRAYIDGLPLDLVSQLLPRRTWLKYSLLSHIHLHARSQIQHQDDADDGASVKTATMNENLHKALIASLTNAVTKLSLPSRRTEWGEYYSATNYTDAAMEEKVALVRLWVKEHSEANQTVHDIGANTGRFSQIASEAGRYVVAHDIDDNAVDFHFQRLQETGPPSILPLMLDLTNPTPGLGWNHDERTSLVGRMGNDFALALALVHHIAISNNVPLDNIAAFFARIAQTLIIEFVPKSDSQVKRLLATRVDIFPDYTQEGFEAAFKQHFEVIEAAPVVQSERTLYLMRRKTR